MSMFFVLMFLFDTEVRNFYDGRMFMHQVSEYKKSQFITQVKILLVECLTSDSA